MSIVSGNGQSATVETGLAAPLVLKIADSTGAGVPGVVVNFTVSPEGAATDRAFAGDHIERRHGDRHGHAGQQPGPDHDHGAILWRSRTLRSR